MNNETVNLPAFLRRRDGKLEMVLHCTWGQDYDLCPQKFWLRYGVQIEGAGPKPALNYGGAVHEALAHRYSCLNCSLADVEAQQMELLEQWFDEKPQQSDEWRTTGRAQDLIRAYNEQYPAHDWEVLGVEEEFELLVGHITVKHPTPDGFIVHPDILYGPLPCYLAGRKDLIVAWHDGIWVVDHKTAQDWGKGDSNSHLDEGRMSFQFRGYAWAEREAKLAQLFPKSATWPVDKDGGFVRESHRLRMALPVLGTVGNYLISRKPYAEGYAPRKGSAPLPRNQFHQEAYAFDASTLDEWRDEFLGMCSDVWRRYESGQWRRKRNACGHWSRCEFYDYCECAPDGREAMLSSSQFQPKEIEREL